MNYDDWVCGDFYHGGTGVKRRSRRGVFTTEAQEFNGGHGVRGQLTAKVTKVFEGEFIKRVQKWCVKRISGYTLICDFFYHGGTGVKRFP